MGPRVNYFQNPRKRQLVEINSFFVLFLNHAVFIFSNDSNGHTAGTDDICHYAFPATHCEWALSRLSNFIVVYFRAHVI